MQSYPLRLPLPLRQALQEMADANRRSLASEIVFRLEALVEAHRRAQAEQGAQR